MGRLFFKQCIDSGYVIAHQRPLEEPIMGDSQLQHPTLIKPEKLVFEKLMKRNNNNFEVAMSAIARKDLYRSIWYGQINRVKNMFYRVWYKIYH